MQIKEAFQNSLKNGQEFSKDFRKKSFENFEKLPTESSQVFKYETYFNNFDFDMQTTSEKNNVMVSSDGLVVRSIEEMIAENPKELENFLHVSDDKFLSFNNAMFDSGYYVYIPKNTAVATPLVIRKEFQENSFSKLIIVVDANSSLNVIEELTSSPDKILCSESTEIVLKENAELKFLSVQNLGKNTVHLTNKNAYCSRDSKIFWNIGLFGSGKVRSRINNFLEGDGSNCEDVELVFSDGEQTFDTFSSLIHKGRHTTGKVLSKSVLKDKSACVFKGMIKIGSNAKNTNSFLAEHAMLLGKDARANAIPSLEIETNDVKATHAASVSQIDEEKIFYLMSRGLDEDTARKLIIFGFFDPLIMRISDKNIREKIVQVIESKWSGKLGDYQTIDSKLKSTDMFEGHYKYR